MTQPVQQVLTAFDALTMPTSTSRQSKSCVAFRRKARRRFSDESLTAAADVHFAEMDAREADASPNRGDVWLVDLGMAAKVRPCFILSIPAADEDRALVTLVPHTTSPRNSRFEIAFPTKLLKPGVFDTQNLVPVPLAKLVRKLGYFQPVSWRVLNSRSGVGWA